MISIFDSGGAFIYFREFDSSYISIKSFSIFSSNDSVLICLLDGYGSGYRNELLIILTLRNGHVMELFRCEGDGSSQHGNLYDRTVRLSHNFSDDNAAKIVRIVDIDYYTLNENEENRFVRHESYFEVYKYDEFSRQYRKTTK